MSAARLLPALLAAGALAADPTGPRVSRASVAAMETSFDTRMMRVAPDEPFQMVGTTHGAYVDGYGVLFTAEVNLAPSAVISPFKPSYSKDDLVRIRAKKLGRLPRLRDEMRQMLVNSAASLDGVPDQQSLALAVTLFHNYWEDTQGLPRQIVMQAQRRPLLDAKLGRAAAADVIRTQEF